MNANPSGARKGKWLVLAICLALAGITWLVFGQSRQFRFVNYDDDIYVLNNKTVSSGLALNGVAAVFTHAECNFYHPLTMITLMANHQFSGENPGAYHLTNVIFHALSVIFLFLALRQMTGLVWRSAFVAAVFAIHPLRAESVAWVAERKDVLSGLFFMLTLWTYAVYVRNVRSRGRYLLVLVFFASGLLCKPSIVTLPFVLLLLDYWPLHRFKDRTTVAGLLVEKIPLFVLSAVAAIIAILAEGQAVTSTGQLPLLTRVGNPVLSCAIYLGQMFYPVNLTPYYPFPVGDLSVWKILLAVILLLGLSLAAIAGRRKFPYLPVGWLWFLGMLVPMIGIVQVGQFAHADRFTYLSQIGLSISIVWLVVDLLGRWPYRRALLASSAIIILFVLIVCARTQAGYWRNSEILWTHALACYPPNNVACSNLGAALAAEHRLEPAIQQYQKAIVLAPNAARTYLDLAIAYTEQGRIDEAIQTYQTAIAKKPDYAEAQNNLGILLARCNRPDEAMTHFQRAVEIRPDYTEARNNLGIVLAGQGHLDRALAEFQEATSFDPSYAEAWCNLANLYFMQGQRTNALEDYRQALLLNPSNVIAREQIHVLTMPPDLTNNATTHVKN